MRESKENKNTWSNLVKRLIMNDSLHFAIIEFINNYKQ